MRVAAKDTMEQWAVHIYHPRSLHTFPERLEKFFVWALKQKIIFNTISVVLPKEIFPLIFGLFVFFVSLPPLRGQPTALCHPRWQPTLGSAKFAVGWVEDGFKPGTAGIYSQTHYYWAVTLSPWRRIERVWGNHFLRSSDAFAEPKVSIIAVINTPIWILWDFYNWLKV